MRTLVLDAYAQYDEQAPENCLATLQVREVPFDSLDGNCLGFAGPRDRDQPGEPDAAQDAVP